jgi:hypothetical protein
MRLWFVETRVFTRRIEQLGLEAGLQALQEALLANPGAGALDAGTGGLRKLRMPAGGRGKRGGARVHYLWLPEHCVVYLLFVYGKNEQASLAASQKQQLKQLVESIRAEWA